MGVALVNCSGGRRAERQMGPRVVNDQLLLLLLLLLLLCVGKEETNVKKKIK